METLLNKKVKLHFSTITTPNAIGIIINETPKTLTVKVTERTFEPKTNDRFPNRKWTDGQIEWFAEHIGFELKFWKDTMIEFGGKNKWQHWSINHII